LVYMKFKKTALFLEILIAATDIILIALNKYTIMSQTMPIRIISWLYLAATLIFMIPLIVNIFKGDGKSDISEQNASDIEGYKVKLNGLGNVKGLSNYTNTMVSQINKLSDRSQLLEKMLKENFGEDGNCADMQNIIDMYRNVFFNNVNKVITRLEIVDRSTLNDRRSVDDGLKAESRQIFKTHIDYIETKVNTNEKIVIEFDKLLTELSRINDSEGENNLDNLQDYIASLKELNDNIGDDELTKVMQRY
ncbi:MAG: hypothetical protein ACI4EF_02075, partial [Coprococcus sp.]